MAKYRIARIPGDDSGHDVMEACMIALEPLGLDVEWVDADAGWCMWEKYGNTVPEKTWEVLRSTDCCLFGSITSRPNVPGFKSAILQIRQGMDLYCNLRPVKAYKGVPLNYRDDIDMVIFRENTEGLYSGLDYDQIPDEALALKAVKEKLGDVLPDEASMSIRLFTRKACRRIAVSAFEYANKYGRKRVTAVHKANVIRATCGMFLEEARKVAENYPEIEYEEQNVDATAMWLIKNPEWYDVLVTTNMFGDIISDEAAQLVGGLGFSSSGNIGDEYALFEPTHGSAPKYAGQYRLNPTAMILSAKLMLEWLGEMEMASRLEGGIIKVLERLNPNEVTYDLGGSATSLEMARAIADAIEQS
ncbi:MAG: isocitrate/isopropylmalate dehydrogenase family protein [Candidatus Coatesbacteria bacterium]|nr:MAG: isocitrate/isopropylmalate dehydrogenase family protein [Candidatus Coatesbacteria bacterium]